MKIRKDKHNNFGTIWSARTKNFLIELHLERSYEKWDGDDSSVQAQIDSGEMIYFDSRVSVEWLSSPSNEEHILSYAYLGNSCYRDGEALEFLKSGYFRDMLSEACNDAREAIADFRDSLPKLRELPSH